VKAKGKEHMFLYYEDSVL